MVDFLLNEPVPKLLSTDRLLMARTSAGKVVAPDAITDYVRSGISSAAKDTYPNSAQSNVPRGVVGTGSITGGTGGATGTFALAFTGGNFAVNPTGTFTVSGGAVTSITFVTPGEYIGASPTAPTLSFAASSGLTGASATATVGFLIANGMRYWTRSADGLSLVQYQNLSGVATAVSPAITMATSEAIDGLSAEVEAAADRAEIAAAEAAAASQVASGVYDPIAEYTGGAVGAFAVPELEYLFTDLAGTINATGVGDVIRRWKPRYTTSANYDQIHDDPAKAPILRKMGQLWYLDYSNGKGTYSAANVPMKCPQQILFAGSFAGTTARAIFGYVKNTNAAHYLASDSNDRVRGYSDGASDIARPFKIATTPDFSAPLSAISVYHSGLLPGFVSAKLESGLSQAGNSPIVSNWVGGDTVAGMTLAINCNAQSLGVGVPNADASCKCFGWMVIDRDFANAAGVVEYFQQYTQIEMRDADLSLFMLTDSTGDDQTVTPEIPKYFAINGLVVDHPTKDVFYRLWNRSADCYTGYQPLTPGDRADRVFLTVAASAGAQPSYFTANRFDRVSDIHHVNERIVGQGHNMSVTEPTAQNHAQAGLLRLGEFIEMEDQLRAKWPNAPVLMQKVHPYRVPGDNRTAPVLASQDILQNDIYRDITFARIDLAFEATGRDPLLYQGDGVHMTAAGVTLAGDTQIAAYRAWVRPGTVTPPVLARRRIPASEMVIPNGLFEDWTGALPTGMTLTNGTVTKSVDEQLHGPSMKLVAPASGASYVEWAFDPVPYQGQTIVLTTWQLIKDGSDFETGQIQAGSNGTGNVGNSWIYTSNKSVETWEPRICHLPIPADATTAFFRLYGGVDAIGTVYTDSVVPARGVLPRDVLR